MNLLFVCSQNRLRSPTAEQVFSEYPGIATMSAGTERGAETPVSRDLVEWADIVFAMEARHRNKLLQNFKDLFKTKRLVVLNIPDEYEYMDPDLVELLKSRVRRHLDL